ncbi:hypothetical protein J4Q44_G00353720 [Coregonus suidteri]|uniref:Uncharacterized protein n=1 Tax=Coregonus suidteri TaxID=861788 RepID=A0AAN8KLC9_9TELE
MKRDTSLFSPDLTVEVSGEEAPYDTSHIYTGEIFASHPQDPPPPPAPCLQQSSHITRGETRPRCVRPVM